MRTISARLSPVASCWERACQLFYQLKGGRVDYGANHAKVWGIERFGHDFGSGLFPNWCENKPIHLVGHSFGGQTARVLQQMLEDREFAGYDTSSRWVLSIACISAPLNGSVRFRAHCRKLAVYPLGAKSNVLGAWVGRILKQTKRRAAMRDAASRSVSRSGSMPSDKNVQGPTLPARTSTAKQPSPPAATRGSSSSGPHGSGRDIACGPAPRASMHSGTHRHLAVPAAAIAADILHDGASTRSDEKPGSQSNSQAKARVHADATIAITEVAQAPMKSAVVSSSSSSLPSPSGWQPHLPVRWFSAGFSLGILIQGLEFLDSPALRGSGLDFVLQHHRLSRRHGLALGCLRLLRALNPCSRGSRLFQNTNTAPFDLSVHGAFLWNARIRHYHHTYYFSFVGDGAMGPGTDLKEGHEAIQQHTGADAEVDFDEAVPLTVSRAGPDSYTSRQDLRERGLNRKRGASNWTASSHQSTMCLTACDTVASASASMLVGESSSQRASSSPSACPVGDLETGGPCCTYPPGLPPPSPVGGGTATASGQGPSCPSESANRLNQAIQTLPCVPSDVSGSCPKSWSSDASTVSAASSEQLHSLGSSKAPTPTGSAQSDLDWPTRAKSVRIRRVAAPAGSGTRQRNCALWALVLIYSSLATVLGWCSAMATTAGVMKDLTTWTGRVAWAASRSIGAWAQCFCCARVDIEPGPGRSRVDEQGQLLGGGHFPGGENTDGALAGHPGMANEVEGEDGLMPDSSDPSENTALSCSSRPDEQHSTMPWPVVPAHPENYVCLGDAVTRSRSGAVPHGTFAAWAAEQVALPAVKTVLLRGMFEAVRFWPWVEEDFRMMYPDFSVKSWLRGGHDGLCGVRTQAFPVVCRGSSSGGQDEEDRGGAMLGPGPKGGAGSGQQQERGRARVVSDLRQWGGGGSAIGMSRCAPEDAVCLPAVPKRWIPPHRFGPLPLEASDVRPGTWYVRRVPVDHVSIVPAQHDSIAQQTLFKELFAGLRRAEERWTAMRTVSQQLQELEAVDM